MNFKSMILFKGGSWGNSFLLQFTISHNSGNKPAAQDSNINFRLKYS